MTKNIYKSKHSNIKKQRLDPALKLSCYVTSNRSDPPRSGAEVKGRQSVRARDNSIKVLESEKRRRWQQQEEEEEEEEVEEDTLRSAERKHRSNSFTLQENTHQHFSSSLSRRTKLDFRHPDWNSNSFPASSWKPAEEGTGSRKCRKQEVPSSTSRGGPL